MKKITLILFALVAFCWQSNSQIFIQENLDSGYPAGWTQSSYFTSTTAAYLCEGSGNIADNMYSSAANDGTITSNNYTGISNETDTTVTFQWLARPYQTNAIDYIIYVEYSTDDGGTWNSVSSFAVTADTPCTTYSEVIPAASLPTGSDFKFQIRGEWQSGDSYFYLDNIGISQVITCPQPSTLDAANIMTTSADLSWMEEGSATLYNVEVVTAGTASTGTASDTGVANPFMKTGLTPSTDYEYYVQADCGGGDVSAWVGPFAFTTLASCPNPSMLNVANVTDASADLGWTAGDSETLWDIELVDITASGTATGTATEMGVSNPYTQMSLTADNDYEFYVRADCGGDTSEWVGPFAFTTNCSALVPNYVADMSVNVPDACWDEASSGDTTTGPMDLGVSDWRQGTSYAYGSSNAINLYFNNDQEWLLSPVFDLSTGGPYQLDVNVAVTNWNGGTTDDDMGSDDEVQLLMSTDGGTTWTNLTTWNAANEPPVEGIDFVEDLTAVTGTVQFAIFATDGAVDDAEDYDFHVGRFEVRDIPSCNEPSGLTAIVTGTDSVDVSWTAGASETEWTYEYGVSPYAQGDGGTTGTVMTDPTLSLIGLTPGESYDIYVQANCGGSDSVYVTTSWSNPNIGDTCEAPIMVASLPYNTSDDTANYGDDYSGSPGATGCGTTFNYMNGDDVVYAYTATADGTINVALSSIGSTYSGMFVYTDCANIGTECVGGNGNSSSTADYNFDVSVTNGTTYYVLISTWAAPQSTTYTLDITEVLCADPSDLNTMNITTTSADLGWTENGTAASWNIELGAAGFTPTGTATATSGTNPYPAMGLTADTAYEFYVQSDCGASQSAWSGPYEFSTVCEAISTDYTADFSNNVPDSCWNEAGSGEVVDGPMDMGASDWKAGRAFTDLDSNVINSNVINLYQSVDREWLISPSFDLDVLGDVGLLVKVAVTNYSFAGTSDATDTDTMGSDDEVQLLMTNDNGSTWSNVTTWNAGNQPEVTGTNYILDMTGMTGSVQFALFASDGAVDDTEDYDFHVGAFEVSSDVLSTNEFENQLAFKYFPNPVKNTLTLNAQNTIENVVMFNMLGQEVLRATPNNVDSHIDMSNLETGTYFVKVTISNISKTIRVIKQ